MKLLKLVSRTQNRTYFYKQKMSPPWIRVTIYKIWYRYRYRKGKFKILQFHYKKKPWSQFGIHKEMKATD
jgi:hypothetical protein